MTDMTSHEYWSEVESIAKGIIKDVTDEFTDEDDIREELDTRLWETIDGHQWVIYTAYNYDVLRHSDNDGYAVENFGADSIIDADGVLNTAALAFGALYGDVSDRLWREIEELSS